REGSNPSLSAKFWKGVRVVEGNSLENCRAGNGTEGSNPSPSARKKRVHDMWTLFLLWQGFEPVLRRRGSISKATRRSLLRAWLKVICNNPDRSNPSSPLCKNCSIYCFDTGLL